jgi:hypothetical protein
MYISILKCGPRLLFIGLSWPSVQVEFDMPVLDGRELSVSHFGRFTHGKRAHSSQRIGGRANFRAVLSVVENRKICSLY